MPSKTKPQPAPKQASARARPTEPLSAVPTAYDFHGDQLDIIKDDDRLWVSVRRVWEAFGIASNGQVARLRQKEWATGNLICSGAAHGRSLERRRSLPPASPKGGAQLRLKGAA